MGRRRAGRRDSHPRYHAIKGDDLVVEFDQDLVLQRFRDEFGIPETVNATLRMGRLILSGEAPHAWLDRVRRDALRVPGIRVVDHRKVENIDLRAFQQTKVALEEAAILFVLNRDSLLPDAEAEVGPSRPKRNDASRPRKTWE